MPDALETLIDRIDDLALRSSIREQVARLRNRRSFGLVYESHLPERVRLQDHPIRAGVSVVFKADSSNAAFDVLEVSGDVATIVPLLTDDETELSTQEAVDASVSDLVVIADFGQPIYPGFRSLGAVERGGHKPSHVVIKAENHHALEALQFSHAGKIDCIYIDPPYNSGARDWKYNNDYVDDNDAYRHSKWLSFMERRLKLSKTLLNPEDSVLIVTIDEREFLRLGLLLEQVFPSARIQMVSSVVNPNGTSRPDAFNRVDEYLFFVRIGDSSIVPEQIETESPREVRWDTFRRHNPVNTRPTRPNQFYPLFVDEKTGKITGVGDPLPPDVDRNSIVPPKGQLAVFPVRDDGTEMMWSTLPAVARERAERGYLRLGPYDPAKPQPYPVISMYGGGIKAIEDGTATITDRRPDGSVRAHYNDGRSLLPTTNWNRPSHNARVGGSDLLNVLLPGRRFPFPKSLYAVEDTLRFFVGNKPNAVILDFFAGSGTTAHATARLNRQDGGQRRAILVTNNAVAPDEDRALRDAGHQPGDGEYEALGIFEHITRPRVTAAISGKVPDGSPIVGNYRFVDEFPISEGFQENVKFFELNYLDPEDVELDLAFASIAPLLWMRAGSTGEVVTESLDSAGRRKPYAWTEAYGVLFNPDRWRSFVSKMPADARTVFIVTDSQATFSGVVAELPTGIDAVRLYENYLSTFAIHGEH